MKVEVETLGPCKKALKVEIPQEVVDAAFKERYNKLKREVHIPGFRPGKAPISILRARFGDYVKADVMERLFKEYYEKALEEAGVTPASEPDFQDVEFDEGKPFTFKVVMEINPEFELGNYEGIEIEKKRYVITDEEVEKFINRLREDMAEYQDKGEEPAEMGDLVVIDYEAFEGDTPIEGGKVEGATYVLGSGETVEGFDEQVVGKKAGDEFEVKVKFPEDHFNKNLAGKEVTFKCRLKSVKRRVIPELNEEFAKRFGVETVEALKEKARAQLEEEFEKRAKAEALSQLAEKLVEGYDFPLPESIVENELKKRIEQYETELRIKGVEPSEEELEKKKEELKEAVEKDLRLMYVLKKIAEKEGIEVTRGDIEEKIEDMAQRTNLPAEQLVGILQQTGRLQFIVEDILTQKTLEFLYEKAKVIEKEEVVGADEAEEKKEGSGEKEKEKEGSE